MNRAMTKQRIRETSARFEARIALLYYLLVIVTGVVIFLVGNRLGFFVDVIATAFILSVTALFYALTRRV